jgi:hypothetical protein
MSGTEQTSDLENAVGIIVDAIWEHLAAEPDPFVYLDKDRGLIDGVIDLDAAVRSALGRLHEHGYTIQKD